MVDFDCPIYPILTDLQTIPPGFQEGIDFRNRETGKQSKSIAQIHTLKVCVNKKAAGLTRASSLNKFFRGLNTIFFS